MKKYFMFYIVLIPVTVLCQEKKETITRDFTVPSGQTCTLWIDNINGSVSVNGYNGSSVIINAVKWVKSSSDQELEQSWQQLQLKFEQFNDTLAAYPVGICDCNCVSHHHGRYWNNCNFRDAYLIDFNIKVPEQTSLLISTVNKGDITVNNTAGFLKIRNVNGSITLDQVSGASDVSTVNGDILINYEKNPSTDSKYYTLNGKLTVYFRPALSADMSFKSFNGKCYTDFDYAMLPASGLVSANPEKSGITYRIERKTLARVGQGGIHLQFETFNGDIFIRRNTN